MSDSTSEQLKIYCPSCQAKLDVTDVQLRAFEEFPCPVCGNGVRVPQVFLQYVLEEELWSNGSVSRYRALETSLGRKSLVVKVTGNGEHGDDRLEAYLGELRKVSLILHPGLPTIYSCGRYEGGVYSACQYCGNDSCLDFDGNGVAWKEARPLIMAAAEAMQKVLEGGVVHGGLGDETIVKDGQGTLKIFGFGEYTALGLHLLDDPHSSPERRSGGAASFSGDLYSFGVWCYRLLTGYYPDEGVDAASVLSRQGGIPVGVTAQIVRMLSASPLERPAGYTSLLSAIQGVLPLMSRRGEGRATGIGGSKVVLSRARSTGDIQTGGGSTGDTAVTGSVASAPSVSSAERLVNRLLVFFGVALALLIGVWVLMRVVPTSSGGNKAGAEPGSGVRLIDPKTGEVISETPMEPLTEVDVSFLEGEVTEEVDESVSREGPRVPKELRRNRPRPRDFRFTGDEVRPYMESLPESYRELEKERVRIVAQMGSYVYSLFKMPYRREEGSELALANGRKISGFIPMGSELSGLTVRLWDGVDDPRAPKNVRLEELDWSEIARILEYYGEKRLEMAGQGLKERRDAFDHYLNSALLCDWYGYRKAARRLAKAGLKAYPPGKKDIMKYGF